MPELVDDVGRAVELLPAGEAQGRGPDPLVGAVELKAEGVVERVDLEESHALPTGGEGRASVARSRIAQGHGDAPGDAEGEGGLLLSHGQAAGQRECDSQGKRTPNPHTSAPQWQL